MTDTLSIRLPGAQMLTTRILCMKCCDLYTVDTIGFEESACKMVDGGKYAEGIYVSAHVYDCLIACKSKTL